MVGEWEGWIPGGLLLDVAWGRRRRLDPARAEPDIEESAGALLSPPCMESNEVAKPPSPSGGSKIGEVFVASES